MGAGIAAALVTAPQALADPAAPAPPPPRPAAGAPVVAAAAPAPPAGDAAPAAGDVAPTAGDVAPAAPTEGVSHLPSPESLPPGTTLDPSVKPNERPNVSYLKDLWHAVQNQEISGKEALIMGLAQRPMNTPYPDEAPGPNVPISPAEPAAPPPAPALPWLPAPSPPAPVPPAPVPPAPPAPAPAP
ncbi:hypothetical protein AU188_05635 [Mycobacterium sp. IS-3022]|nr:hypothetical protein AU188_05635 [Mycobacterium sp. IS-3022]